MKITYERLNQIIEEEVVKFKRLNEGIDSSKVDAMIGEIKGYLSSNPGKLSEFEKILDDYAKKLNPSRTSTIQTTTTTMSKVS